MIDTNRTAAAGILALDQGTTNTKAIFLDPATGQVLASASRPVGIAFPRPGWVEQDAEQLWSATLEAAQECLAAVDATPAAVSISNQRESVVCWSRSTGEPLGPVLGWQDARTAAWCVGLAAARPDAAELVRRRTGLSLDPMFSAPKMRAALDAAVAAGADPDDVALGTVDAWLVRRLTGVAATDAGNASRTLLLDLETLDWHPELLDLFGVPAAALPEVRASDAGFGVTLGEGRLPAGVPVAAVLADSHSALYHHGCTEPGTGKATFGTGSSVMTPLAGLERAPEGIATTVAWQAGGAVTYAREGNIVATGSALDWMATTLGVPPGLSGGAFLTALAADVPDAGGVAFVPAFSGLGAPYWDRDASGVLTGVTGGTRREHLARAALESVAHQVADVVEAIESDGRVRLAVLNADGGATASGLLMQTQADLLDRPVEVSDVAEASALGAALLAARTLGLPTAHPAPGRRVVPTPDAVTTRGPARAAWAAAVARSRGLAVPATD
ncbi:FGGY family carbohydrate kinase [Actinotalea sp. M2MS4P-6]|uniref:FGGY family carbohydrate kinase n=1 Tax=Actinotalea sp. M2MS4P-6 TaxID=2983762 RepID=UPI0021E4BB72|nr:FGGY family carbohydrate kinase [Actinotalea sp. M2MS4P-6]MCV2394212.1 FGGY family carbohydrate kinase [Actinotalea sp. M2MS4P-6]